MASTLFPVAPQDLLLQSYRGRNLHDVPVPAVVVDVAKVRANCRAMLHAVHELGVSFRAHVKTHKTSEITRLQVSDECRDVRLVVSTVIEAEHLVPLLQEYKSRGASVNLVYGIPVGPSHVPRLADVGRALGPGSVTVMVDNEAQMASVQRFKQLAGFPVGVFVKADSGYHRAGLTPDSADMAALLRVLAAAEQHGDLHLVGFYSHNSLSYGGSSPNDAMDMLRAEIEACHRAAQPLQAQRPSPLVVSVGATPSAVSVQNLLSAAAPASTSADALRQTLDLVQSNFELEIHAGVYAIFDVQQVAASSRHAPSDPHDTIAASVLCEVCSVYPTRTDTPEVLVSAGTLALAREPCKGYSGWGIVSSWNMATHEASADGARVIVDRISQEHGILAAEDKRRPLDLQYGQRLRIWPNHACITLAMHGHYLIVDSDTADPDNVVDVWVRWRGW